MSDESERPDKYDQAVAIIESHREEIMSKTNVVGIGVGYRQLEGKMTRTIAVVVMVTQKIPPEKLPKKDRIPCEIDGVPIDVQEIGNIAALD